jgi:hypothetical protein
MRELLEQMVYKLEMQGLLLAAGRTRWLPFLNSEIESLMEAVNAVDAARSQASARLARRYGLRPYRRPRQKRSTIMVRLPRAFSDQILWPEFVQLNEVPQDEAAAL